MEGIMQIELIKSIIDLCSSIFVSLGVIIATFKGISFFKYKNDESIRKLYIENAKKISTVLSFHISYAKLDNEREKLLFDAFEEASLYLHKEIVEYIDTIKNLIIDIECLGYEFNNLPGGKERSKLSNKQFILKKKLGELSKQRLEIYRKYIMQDGLDLKKYIDNFKDYFQQKEEM